MGIPLELVEAAFRKELEQLICNKCNRIFVDPVATNCRHVYCLSCFETLVNTRCPIDGTVLNSADTEPFIDPRPNIVRDLVVACNYRANGCTSWTRRGQLESHLNECQFRSSMNRKPIGLPKCQKKVVIQDQKSSNSSVATMGIPMDVVEAAFREELNQLNCNWCNKIFVEPVTADCGHDFCGKCFEVLPNKSCPIDGTSLTSANTRPFRDRRADIAIDLVVPCFYRWKGCTSWAISGQQKSHLDECRFKPSLGPTLNPKLIERQKKDDFQDQEPRKEKHENGSRNKKGDYKLPGKPK